MIGLVRRPERRNRMIACLEELDFNYTLFDAVDGRWVWHFCGRSLYKIQWQYPIFIFQTAEPDLLGQFGYQVPPRLEGPVGRTTYDLWRSRLFP